MGLKFNKKQAEGWRLLASDGKTRILFDGGSRSGKTVLISEYLVRRALQYPSSRQLTARKCRNHAKISVWNDTLKNYLRKFIPSNLYKLSETELTVTFFNGSQIITGGLDDAERVEKILGNEYITVFLNEATQLSWETVQMCMTRLAQKAYNVKTRRRAVPKLILDCNPRGPRHWLHSVGVRHVDPETDKPLSDADAWGRLNFSAYDNMENLPKEYIAALEAMPEVMRDRMLNGVWRDNSGSVYDEFSEDVHTVEPFKIPSSWHRFRAIDFGYTNPFVCLWGAVDGDGRLFIYREWYKSRTRTRVHAEKILLLSDDEKYVLTVADHDAADRAELEAEGVRTEAAEKSVVRGIQAVKNRLVPAGDGRPRIVFFNDLRHTLSEIYDYRWAAPNGEKSEKEEPVKLNDHAMDALRYMVVAVDRYFGTKKTLSAKSRRLSDTASRWQ